MKLILLSSVNINNRYRDAIVQNARASHCDISGEKNFYQFNLPTIFRE